ncbi:MAG: cytochrome c [Lewinellaceae bacterium]|nr:cytochrome c [Phaeodactylibacter sp.]MCB9352025.1 cytochrome c [Lewinellaceae bacterium]
MKNNLKHILFVLVATVVIYSCSPADSNYPGSEYMPDMAHSVAQEANVYNYYYYNTWDSASTIRLKELAYPGLPVEGTMPRGYAGVYFAAEKGEQASDVIEQLRGYGNINNIAVPVNGHVPYHYGDTEEERTRATQEIIANPFPITDAGLARGKELYDIFCGICHGPKGGGLGYLVSDENPNVKYPAAPANFLLDQFLTASNGRYYHAIMYGRNVMGAYKDKISYEERWQVIHYIRSLQAKDKKLEYSEQANTLNPEFGVPGSQVQTLAESISDQEAEPEAAPAEEEANPEPGSAPGENTHGGDSHGKK